MGVRWDETEDIDELGTSYLKGLYSTDGWKFFHITPDRGIDHFIEFFESNNLSGVSVSVQLKSHRRVKRLGKQKDYVSNDLECEHLAYYLKMRQPVFLVVVDVTEKIGYWVFLQKHADTALKNSDWRLRMEIARAGGGKNRPEVKIRLPVGNQIRDREAFKRAMIDANGYMARRGILHGLRYAREQYEALDPRIMVEATATEQGESYSLHPQTDIQLSLSFSKEFVESGRWETLIGRGLPVQITPGSVRVEGSLLFETLLDETAANQGRMSLKFKKKGHLSMARIDQDGNVLARLDSMGCEYEGGSVECRYDARLSDGLLRLSSSYEPGCLGPRGASMDYSFRPWIGCPVLDLPHFDSLYRVFGTARPTDRWRMRLVANGIQIASATMELTPHDIETYSEALGAVYKIRWIASRFDLNPCLRRYTEKEANEISALYDVLNGEEISRPIGQARLTAVIPHNHSWLFSSAPGGELRVFGPMEREFNFLGHRIKVDGLERYLSHLRFENEPDDIRRRFEEGADEVSVTLVPTEKTRMVYRLAGGTDTPEGPSSLPAPTVL